MFIPINCYHFADIKAYFVDVKPAIPSAIDVEFEKNPYEVRKILGN